MPGLLRRARPVLQSGGPHHLAAPLPFPLRPTTSPTGPRPIRTGDDGPASALDFFIPDPAAIAGSRRRRNRPDRARALHQSRPGKLKRSTPVMLDLLGQDSTFERNSALVLGLDIVL